VTEARAYKEATVALRVVRCGCGDPASHPGAICPHPRADDDLGVVAFTSNNPWKRLLWRLWGKSASERRIQHSNRR
jgi:hypothetical protein